MSEKSHHCFIDDKIPHVIWRYSFPMVGAILALLFYDLLESSLLALSSADTLTALGFTLPVTTAMTAIAIGTSIRCNNKVVKLACLQQEQVAKTITASLTSASFIILMFTLLGLLFGDSLLGLLGNNDWRALKFSLQSTTTADQQSTYMLVRYLGWIFLALIWQTNAIFRALGLTRIASILMLSWLATKSLLAIILLSPSSPFHQQGLLGISIVHGVSDFLFSSISLYILSQKLSLKLPSFDDITANFHQPKFDAFMVVAQQLITPISMAILTLIAASIDYSYVAAFALIFRLEAILLLLPMVLTTSMPAIIGTNFWSGHHHRVSQAYLLVFSTIITAQILIAIVIYYQYDFLTALICPQTSVAILLKQYFIWVPIGYVGAGCAIVYQSCLNAKGKTAQATALGIMHRIVLLLPLALIGSMLSSQHSFFQGIMLGHLAAGLSVVLIFKYIKIRQHLNTASLRTNMQSR
jgi:Na+-driven multidrug efflux pump